MKRAALRVTCQVTREDRWERVGRGSKKRPEAENAAALKPSARMSTAGNSLQAVCGWAVDLSNRQATSVSLMVLKSAIWDPNSMGLPPMVMSATRKPFCRGHFVDGADTVLRVASQIGPEALRVGAVRGLPAICSQVVEVQARRVGEADVGLLASQGFTPAPIWGSLLRSAAPYLLQVMSSCSAVSSWPLMRRRMVAAAARASSSAPTAPGARRHSCTTYVPCV